MKIIASSIFAPRYRSSSRLAAPLARPGALWPTVSIVVLLCVSIIFAPLLVSILNLALLLLAGIVMLAQRRKLDARLSKLAIPFIAITFIGLATGQDPGSYDYFKDVWYALNPLLVIAIGYILYSVKPNLALGLRAFVIGGLIIALWQSRAYAFNPDIILLPAATIRGYIGTGFYAPVLAVIIFMVFRGHWRTALRLPNWIAVLMLTIAAVAVAGSFSRTAVLVVGIGLLAALGAFAKREWLRLGGPMLVLGSLALIMQLTTGGDSDRAALQTFGSKLVRSFDEVLTNDFSTIRDINLNFRAYETHRAVQQFTSGSFVDMAFGQGFGARVDLGLFMPLQLNDVGDRSVRYIPILHNGYMYLLTKVGVIGLLLYLSTVLYIYGVSRRAARGDMGQDKVHAGRLLQAAVVTLLVTTYIIGGVFNKFDLFPFILVTGYLLGHLWNDEPGVSGAGPAAAQGFVVGAPRQVAV